MNPIEEISQDLLDDLEDIRQEITKPCKEHLIKMQKERDRKNEETRQILKRQSFKIVNAKKRHKTIPNAPNMDSNILYVNNYLETNMEQNNKTI